jgi:predicted AlkP superfamily pyrophosphatase or phosphodiesterase
LTDEDRTDAAVHLLKAHRPHLLLLHIFDLDTAQHDFGPWSAEAKAALEASDALVGRVRAAVEAAGIADRTLFAIVSDHGFLPVERALKPNALLRQAGLLEVDGQGKVRSWRAYFHSNGGSAGLHLKEPGDRALLAQVARLFEPLLGDPTAGLAEILGAGRVAELGGSADWPLVLDARQGFAFSGKADGEGSEPAEHKGYHGYAPDRPALYASLLVSVPGLARRGDLGVVKMTAIAPTLAAFLRVDLARAADQPLALLPPP